MTARGTRHPNSFYTSSPPHLAVCAPSGWFSIRPRPISLAPGLYCLNQLPSPALPPPRPPHFRVRSLQILQWTRGRRRHRLLHRCLPQCCVAAQPHSTTAGCGPQRPELHRPVLSGSLLGRPTRFHRDSRSPPLSPFWPGSSCLSPIPGPGVQIPSSFPP